jgi:hypothetical protein
MTKTGLPQLPKGYFWSIRTMSFSQNYAGVSQKLPTLQIRHRRLLWSKYSHFAYFPYPHLYDERKLTSERRGGISEYEYQLNYAVHSADEPGNRATNSYADINETLIKDLAEVLYKEFIDDCERTEASRFARDQFKGNYPPKRLKS